jgi:Fe2+ or Zn2+ uptake regulation protein
MTGEGDPLDQIPGYLHARGIRYTPGRRAVIEALAEANGPKSAAELAEARSLPLSSVYRSLAVLEGAGVVVRHQHPEGSHQYELAEWLAGHHHHVVCMECGEVEDVHLDEDQERTLRALAAAVARGARYRIGGHVLEVEGVCRRCGA